MHKIESSLLLLLVTFYNSLPRKLSPHLYNEINNLRDYFPQPLRADLLGTCALFWHWEGMRFGIPASFSFFSMLIKLSIQPLFCSFNRTLVNPVPGPAMTADTWGLVPSPPEAQSREGSRHLLGGQLFKLMQRQNSHVFRVNL